MKICFLSHNFMNYVWGGGTIQEHENIYTKYEFDILIIYGSFGEQRRQHDRQQTTDISSPQVS